MRVKFHQVDAFAAAPFGGNPAAVIVLDAPADARWMQHVAREMNLSETAFLHREGDGFHLRWFTPAVEVALCGHATLASAHVLWETGALKLAEPARFQTKSGLLTAQRRGNLIEMNFPAKRAEVCDAPAGLAEALGCTPRWVGRSAFDYLVEVVSEETLRKLQPDFRALRALPVRGIIATSRSASPGFDFVSRFFAPASGVDEDPVTGSAHCALGLFWQERLRKDDFTAFQASARGGVVRVGVRGERVLLAGQAVTVVRGELAEDACK
ncbi:MAG TPA: PhzF family phenazine biosynthesis protein [Verrucomicrobiae bacterium]